MSRIVGVAPKKAGFFGRMIYRMAAKRYGVLMEPLAVSRHHGGVFYTYAVHELMAERVSRTLPKSVRELAVYRAAVRLGCEWCIDFGTMLQRLDGLDVERLREIDDYATSPRFTHEERLAIAYADAMTATPVQVTDEQVAELTEAFGEKGVIELTYQIALENMRARFNSGLGITEQGFSSGDACRVPLTR
ncbi:carboxymuconolactone decarboxylase family protein [Kibdelosporangium persicum]|uniref:Alkylhydroperoxidase family enzyme, contains CxxC motif n=1 Tax=Kibdelosporangium persicum TaxID=2698649 RepID=A0ABX2F634_9PSEU|nr:carboxymuconolactone decarboxylase family protein [Kibdelosporangium persicum]NRN66821.1 Alkylhydroperoxidase family enzyme, contains CxxC motif [Kibdelosporangium persicum]